MLYIELIDDYNVRFGNAIGGGTYPKVYPKTMVAKSDEADQIWILDYETKAYILNARQPATVALDGTIYTDANSFVIAFNQLFYAGNFSSAGGSGDTTSLAASYNTPGGGELENASTTFAANTIHSLTVTCLSGTAVVTAGSETINLEAGQTIGWTASALLDKAIVVDASGDAANKVDYSYIGPAPTTTTTTTTTAPVTTTTTTAP